MNCESPPVRGVVRSLHQAWSGEASTPANCSPRAQRINAVPSEWHTLVVPPTANRGPGRPAAAKAEETRRRIISVARQMFSERGLEGASLTAIATQAGVTRPAINYYFSSKRALYIEVTNVTTDLVLAAGLKRVNHERTLLGRIAAFAAAAAEADAQNPSTASFLAMAALEFPRHPDLRDIDNKLERTTRDLVTRAVNEAVDSGELATDTDTDVASYVEVLLLILCAVAFYPALPRGSRDTEAIIDSLRRLLTGSLLRQADLSPEPRRLS